MACARYEEVCGVAVIPKYGKNLTQMFEAMEHGDLSALYVIGENPASSEADVGRARKLMGNLDTLIVQDLFMTKTAEMADVVLPASNAALESEGSVTNSERRVQRVRKVLEPPGNAKDDIWIIVQLAKRLGVADGEVVRVTSRRGSVEAPISVDRGLRPGLVFMTLHFPDQVDTNILTIDATDPKSGTAEFKASAVRIEKISASVGA